MRRNVCRHHINASLTYYFVYWHQDQQYRPRDSSLSARSTARYQVYVLCIDCQYAYIAGTATRKGAQVAHTNIDDVKPNLRIYYYTDYHVPAYCNLSNFILVWRSTVVYNAHNIPVSSFWAVLLCVPLLQNATPAAKCIGFLLPLLRLLALVRLVNAH